ncbi:hydrogenase formation protein HypD [Desulfovibrio sp. UCD-KL4C]|uniref:hydrogenase formation protein HypD n=1 Tax=Desulfovibrio sp. UCD-KL4C TaxID=2578120 RepID=UPI0025C1E196|nr:hydrogenase formation protein HypD [Desulfovibrio sp. UCD-KL4C]
MSLKVLEQFKNPELCKELLDCLNNEIEKEIRFMEVCGTHTVAIFRSGLHSVLPEKIIHLSGPGCPVCVTHESEVNAFLDLAGKERVVIATFGDLIKVPGKNGHCLKNAQAEGARVEIIYSPFDALEIARKNPDDTVVFLGVGFETTAPAIAATVLMAEEQKLENFKVLSFHKLVPPALDVLISDPETKIDGFLLPGHVSTVIGIHPYDFIGAKYGKPAIVAGFEPVDILLALLQMVRSRKEVHPEVVNQYQRGVSENGNPKAVEVMYQVFKSADALWRGIGMIKGSGLEFADRYERFDAKKVFDIKIGECPALPGCKCGEVLKGKMTPDQCPLFGKACNPASPVGPCMVSTEGSCAAYFKYKVD